VKNLLERYRALWDTRAPRERALLAGLTVFVIVAALAQLLWASHQARARLDRQIPQLRHQLETLERKASDLQQIRAQSPVTAPVDREGLLASAVASARIAALPEVATMLKLEAPGRLRLRGTLPFDRWIAWIATLQQEGHLRLVSCSIEAAEAPGSAKIDALFSLPDAG